MPLRAPLVPRQPPVHTAALIAARTRAASAVQALLAIRNTDGIRLLSPDALNAETCAELNALVAVNHVLLEVGNLGGRAVKQLPDRTLVCRDREGTWQVIARPVRASRDAAPDHLFNALMLDTGHVPRCGEAVAPCATFGRMASVEDCMQRVVERMARLLARPAVPAEGRDSAALHAPLKGQDLRGIYLPPNLARHALIEVNLSGQDLSGIDLRGAVFCRADLRATLLPQDLGNIRLLGCDLRGAQISSDCVGSPAAQAWPDLSGALMAGAIVDTGAWVQGGSGDLIGVGNLLDAHPTAPTRSLLRSLHGIADADVRRDAVERLLVAVAARLSAQAPGARLLDILFGEHGGGHPERRHRYATALAALLFEPGYSSNARQPGITWLRGELASELAEQARAYSGLGGVAGPMDGDTASMARLALRQPAFPPVPREQALSANPELNG